MGFDRIRTHKATCNKYESTEEKIHCGVKIEFSVIFGPEKLENMSAKSTKIQGFSSVNNSQEVFGQKWIIYCCHNSLREKTQ